MAVETNMSPAPIWQGAQETEADLSGIRPGRHKNSLTLQERDLLENSSRLPPSEPVPDVAGNDSAIQPSDSGAETSGAEQPMSMPATETSPPSSPSTSEGPSQFESREAAVCVARQEEDAATDSTLRKFNERVVAARNGEPSILGGERSPADQESPAATESDGHFSLSDRAVRMLNSERRQSQVAKAVLGQAGFRMNAQSREQQEQYYRRVGVLCAGLSEEDVLDQVAQALSLCSQGIWGETKIVGIIQSWLCWVALGDWLRDLSPVDFMAS